MESDAACPLSTIRTSAGSHEREASKPYLTAQAGTNCAGKRTTRGQNLHSCAGCPQASGFRGGRHGRGSPARTGRMTKFDPERLERRPHKEREISGDTEAAIVARQGPVEGRPAEDRRASPRMLQGQRCMCVRSKPEIPAPHGKHRNPSKQHDHAHYDHLPMLA